VVYLVLRDHISSPKQQQQHSQPCHNPNPFSVVSSTRFQITHTPDIPANPIRPNRRVYSLLSIISHHYPSQTASRLTRLLRIEMQACSVVRTIQHPLPQIVIYLVEPPQQIQRRIPQLVGIIRRQPQLHTRPSRSVMLLRHTLNLSMAGSSVTPRGSRSLLQRLPLNLPGASLVPSFGNPQILL
jgi:hypothetical protein